MIAPKMTWLLASLGLVACASTSETEGTTASAITSPSDEAKIADAVRFLTESDRTPGPTPLAFLNRTHQAYPGNFAHNFNGRPFDTASDSFVRTPKGAFDCLTKRVEGDAVNFTGCTAVWPLYRPDGVLSSTTFSIPVVNVKLDASGKATSSNVLNQVTVIDGVLPSIDPPIALEASAIEDYARRAGIGLPADAKPHYTADLTRCANAATRLAARDGLSSPRVSGRTLACVTFESPVLGDLNQMLLVFRTSDDDGKLATGVLGVVTDQQMPHIEVEVY